MKNERGDTFYLEPTVVERGTHPTLPIEGLPERTPIYQEVYEMTPVETTYGEGQRSLFN